MFKIKIVILFLFIFVMLSCATSLKVTNLNDSGYFNTKRFVDKVLFASDVDISNYKKLLYVKSELHRNNYDDFLVGSFYRMGIFENVVGKKELERMIVEKGFEDKVKDVSSFIQLRQFQKLYGNFLILDLDDVRKSPGLYYKAHLKVYDPSNGEILLHIFKEGVNWSGIDQPIFYPLFNGFLDWAHGRKIRTE